LSRKGNLGWDKRSDIVAENKGAEDRKDSGSDFSQNDMLQTPALAEQNKGSRKRMPA